MSTTLELPDDVIRALNERAAQTGQPFGELVVRLLKRGLTLDSSGSAAVPDEAMLQRRRDMIQKFVSGEIGLELAGFEEGRAADRRRAAERAQNAQ